MRDIRLSRQVRSGIVEGSPVPELAQVRQPHRCVPVHQRKVSLPVEMGMPGNSFFDEDRTAPRDEGSNVATRWKSLALQPCRDNLRKIEQAICHPFQCPVPDRTREGRGTAAVEILLQILQVVNQLEQNPVAEDCFSLRGAETSCKESVHKNGCPSFFHGQGYKGVLAPGGRCAAET